MTISLTADRRDARYRGRELSKRFGTAALREMFINRTHDNLFAFVAEPMTGLSGPECDRVWLGFEITVANNYSPFARMSEQQIDNDGTY